MNLMQQSFHNAEHKTNRILATFWQLKNLTLIWWAPPVPSLCSTSHNNLQMRSLASDVNLASSGNLKWFLQWTIWKQLTNRISVKKCVPICLNRYDWSPTKVKYEGIVQKTSNSSNRKKQGNGEDDKRKG